jgi:hypothetical protein
VEIISMWRLFQCGDYFNVEIDEKDLYYLIFTFFTDIKTIYKILCPSTDIKLYKKILLRIHSYSGIGERGDKRFVNFIL